MQNIMQHFGRNLDAAPKVLFGDNDVDNERDAATTPRQYWGGQAQWVGHYDRHFGYGIVTTFYAKHCEQRLNASSSMFQGRQSPDKVWHIGWDMVSAVPFDGHSVTVID